MKTVCCTGHRPKSLPTGYDITPLIALAKPWLTARKPDAVISGMALGWDQAVAIAAMDRSIPVHAYIHFTGQADQWPEPAIYEYMRLLGRCETRQIVSPGGYEPWKMQARNEAMVDACDMVLALWNGEEKGGTYNCVKYALEKGIKVDNLFWIYNMDV